MRIMDSHLTQDQHTYIVDNLNLSVKSPHFHTDGKVKKFGDSFKITGGNFFYAINNGIVLSIIKFNQFKEENNYV